MVKNTCCRHARQNHTHVVRVLKRLTIAELRWKLLWILDKRSTTLHVLQGYNMSSFKHDEGHESSAISSSREVAHHTEGWLHGLRSLRWKPAFLLVFTISIFVLRCNMWEHERNRAARPFSITFLRPRRRHPTARPCFVVVVCTEASAPTPSTSDHHVLDLGRRGVHAPPHREETPEVGCGSASSTAAGSWWWWCGKLHFQLQWDQVWLPRRWWRGTRPCGWLPRASIRPGTAMRRLGRQEDAPGTQPARAKLVVDHQRGAQAPPLPPMQVLQRPK